MPDYYYWIIGLFVLLVIAAIVAKMRISKIDHTAPEHRAKENELYEALGVEKPHETEVPEDHSKKEKEVENAFSKEGPKE